MRLLRAHCSSNGRFTQHLDRLLRNWRPPAQPSDKTGVLGTFTVKDQKHIVDCIARDGFYIFDNRLPGALCDGIQDFASRTPATIGGEMTSEADPVIYDPAQPRGRLYKFREQDADQCDAVQALMADQVLLAIAEFYLGTQTVIGGVDLWWSTTYGNGPSSDAAQLFHFDFDAPPRWLKLFVYVTDVGPGDGPHVFVKGSHRNGLDAAKDLRARGYMRISDEEIVARFGQDAIQEFLGQRGTVFFADTRAFHKGKHPTAADRLLAQMIYCSPVFNDHAERPPNISRISAPLAAAIEKKPRAYSRYLPQGSRL